MIIFSNSGRLNTALHKFWTIKILDHKIYIQRTLLQAFKGPNINNIYKLFEMGHYVRIENQIRDKFV